MTARAIMLQGTGSDVGKTVLVTGLIRALVKRGHSVAPFKPQNMSNNAGVTADGGEIGRGQMLQALAAGLPPSVHMNPVLLKPQSAMGAQLIVQGRMRGNFAARAYQDFKASLMPDVLMSFESLRQRYDFVVVEGAGSASEINLRAHDIANMGFSRAAKVPVVLVGDIDRGGVIASVAGTKTVLEAHDAAQIKGFIINKMRGDLSLFDDGMRFLRDTTGWAALGLVPFFPGARKLPAEDGLALSGRADSSSATTAKRHVVVLAYPMISNFDDFDPLEQEPGVRLTFLKVGTPVPGDADCVILPGSKSTLSDLEVLRQTGWDIDIAAFLRRGGAVFGVCGGFQMLGQTINDPEGVESTIGKAPGLGLLDATTRMTRHKTLRQVSGHVLRSNSYFSGFEMHVGETTRGEGSRPLLAFADGTLDGGSNATGSVAGAYVHGLFHESAFRTWFLTRLGARSQAGDHAGEVLQVLDDLAAHLERYVNIDEVIRLAE